MIGNASHMRRLMMALLLTAACAQSQKASEPAKTTDSKSSPATKSTAAKLPDFTLETIDGSQFTLSDHVGRDVIVMSFWATWCGPCKVELPHLDALYNEEKENGLVIVALAMDEPTTVAEVAPTAQRLGLTMPVALDTNQRAVALYNRSRSAPMTVVIDKQGRIVHQAAGYNPGDEVKLAQAVRTLLAQ